MYTVEVYRENVWSTWDGGLDNEWLPVIVAPFESHQEALDYYTLLIEEHALLGPGLRDPAMATQEWQYGYFTFNSESYMIRLDKVYGIH